ncbi:MAG: hypothetical protein R2912_06510 [Eubacteriales bacterium]
MQAVQSGEVGSEIVDRVLYTTPLRLMSSESSISPRQIEGIVMLLNRKLIRGLIALLGL